MMPRGPRGRGGATYRTQALLSYVRPRRVLHRHSRVLSVRVSPRHRRTLRGVMRGEGLASEAEAAQLLIERAAQRKATEQIVARLRRRRWRGPRVNASEEHDRVLPETGH